MKRAQPQLPVSHQLGTPWAAPTRGRLSQPTARWWCVHGVSVGSCSLQRCCCEGSLLAVQQHGDPVTFDPIPPDGQGICLIHVPTTGMCNFWFSTFLHSLQTFPEKRNGTNYCFSFLATCSWSGLCLSGKIPELRLTGLSFDFKATLSLHTMLPFHPAFPFSLLDSPPQKTLTSSLASYGTCQTIVLPRVSCPFSIHSSSYPSIEAGFPFDWRTSVPWSEGTQHYPSPVVIGLLHFQALEEWRTKTLVWRGSWEIQMRNYELAPFFPEPTSFFRPLTI